MSLKKGDKKVIKAWTMYDWANSVYPLVITTAIFPLYYKGHVGDEAIVFGRQLDSVEVYSYAIALSLLIVSVLSPLLSGIADYSGSKKLFMRIFNYVGAFSCAGLYLWEKIPIELGLTFCMTANIGFWGSLVFYNAYLPEIAHREDHDKISAQGFSKGYLGSAILLVLCLAFVKVLGGDAKYCFLFVGIWWIGFAQISYRRLPRNVYDKKVEVGRMQMFGKGFKELQNVWREFSTIKRLKRFLVSFFVFSMAVQTIMTMAQFFGTNAVDWSLGMGLDFSNLSQEDIQSIVAHVPNLAEGIVVDEGFNFTEVPTDDVVLIKNAHPEVGSRMETSMIISILLIQLIAIPGAMLFASLSKRWGNIKVLLIALLVWIGICTSAYVVTTPFEFYVLASAVGVVMGGIQSLSRSTYSKFLPETTDHASYFSFYDVLEKIGMTIGIVSFGFLTGEFNIRYSVMALTVFFIIGLLLLLRVPKEEIPQEVNA